MPTYDYVCKLCEHAFEHFQGIHEPLLRKCPSCGRRGLQRLIGSGAGIVFKGSGFYETDYKRGPTRDRSPGSGGSGAAKSDTPTGDGRADAPKSDPPGRPGPAGDD